jgi:hypothetical protein
MAGISNALFLAILAMDSYNRGPGAQVTVSGNAVGKVSRLPAFFKVQRLARLRP